SDWRARSPAEGSVCVVPAPSTTYAAGDSVTVRVAGIAYGRPRGDALCWRLELRHLDGSVETGPTGTVAVGTDPVEVVERPTRHGPYRVALLVDDAPTVIDAFAVVPRRSAPPPADSPFGGH